MLRKRLDKSSNDQGEKVTTAPMDDHEQVSLIDELRKQALEDYEFQQKIYLCVCFLFAGISIYISEFHGVHVNLIVRLLSATLHMISGLISGQYSKMGSNNKTCFFKDEDRKALDMFSFIMIFIQIIHIIFTYDVDKRDVWGFPVLLVIGNICTCVLAMNFRRDIVTTMLSIDELMNLRYNHKSV